MSLSKVTLTGDVTTVGLAATVTEVYVDETPADQSVITSAINGLMNPLTGKIGNSSEQFWGAFDFAAIGWIGRGVVDNKKTNGAVSVLGF
jgi:hypothetical protein